TGTCLISMIRVVVKQHHVLHSSESSEGNGVLEGAMPPTDVLGIFRAAILGIMDQQVGLSSQVVSRRPCRTHGKLWHSESRFMISDIGQRRISRRNPIAHSRTGV